jgi:hypothetical protein
MAFGRLSFGLIVLITAMTIVGVSSVSGRDWSGVYTHDEESFEIDGSRLSYWFRLEVLESGSSTTAILSNGINGKATRRIQLSAAVGPTRIRFYYDHCLPLTEGTTEPCTDEFNTRDELFLIEEVPRHCQFSLETTWQKLNLSLQTESGGGTTSVFFKSILD